MARQRKKGKPSGYFVVRIEPDLHERLIRLAELERRSLNAQVEFMLERSAFEREAVHRGRERLLGDQEERK